MTEWRCRRSSGRSIRSTGRPTRPPSSPASWLATAAACFCAGAVRPHQHLHFFAFVVVCASPPLFVPHASRRARPFRAASGPVAPILGTRPCTIRIFSFAPGDWWRPFIWWPGDLHRLRPQPKHRITARLARVSNSQSDPLAIVEIYVFILAAFVGFQVITRVPPLLHTPLMSATNAISGISLVGSLVAAGADHGALEHRARRHRRDLRHHQRGRRVHDHRPHAEDVQPRGQAAAPRAKRPPRAEWRRLLHPGGVPGRLRPVHPRGCAASPRPTGPPRHAAGRGGHAAGRRRHAAAPRHRPLRLDRRRPRGRHDHRRPARA